MLLEPMALHARLSLTCCLTLGETVTHLHATEYPRPPFKKTSEGIVRSNDLKSMSIDDLWKLHEELALALAQKMQSEKTKLEQRLRQLQETDNISGPYRSSRPYPPVLPKYRNPKKPTETWSGRGKQPRWLGPQIQAGRRLDDFLIDRDGNEARHRGGNRSRQQNREPSAKDGNRVTLHS
jgi:DNA-binding protein H-NS